MKTLVIANPISGGGKGRRLADALTMQLRKRGIDVETFLTSAAGDAFRRAESLGEQIDRIVVVGGDGTLNEIINGLHDPSRTPIAQLPVGTANILAHELKLPRRPDQVAAMVAAGRVRTIDYGLVNGTRFFMVVSAGFDAMVTRAVKQRRRGSLGYKGYLVPIVQTLYQYRTPSLHVSVDEGQPITGALVIVGNTRNYGGLFSVTDRAQCDSGFLDVCVFPKGSPVALGLYALAAVGRRVSRLTNVVYRTGRRITITADRPTPVQIDGDYFGQTPTEITIQPAAVSIIVPAR